MSKRVLVVGTTSDYIDHIRQHCPGRAIFVTDPVERACADEEHPDASEEILCDLCDEDMVLQKLSDHLHAYGITLDGIVCYDCESLELSSLLAKKLALPFPSPDSVASSRDKFKTRTIWHKNKVFCPRMKKAGTISDAMSFMADSKSPVVLKPLTGSGSELVFKCTDDRECSQAFVTIKTRLAMHQNKRMYPVEDRSLVTKGPGIEFAAEEFISGTEYSCDFIINEGRIRIVRIAQKIPASSQSFGTTLAYMLPGILPEEISEHDFSDQLLHAAQALGIDRAVCMVDFIVQESAIFFLEMTPRVGGDCLPPLILSSCGLDMIALALDFAQGKEISVPEKSRWRHLVGLRVFAETAGIISMVDDLSVRRDPRVITVHITHSAGRRVTLPPDDYDSRILGYIVFRPQTSCIEQECSELTAKLGIEMEAQPWIQNQMS